MCDTVYIPEAKMRNTSLTRNEKKKLLNIDVPYGKISDTMPVITWRENAYTDYWLIEFQRIDITKNDNEKYYIKIYVGFLYLLVLLIFYLSYNYRCNLSEDDNKMCNHNKIAYILLSVFIFILASMYLMLT